MNKHQLNAICKKINERLARYTIDLNIRSYNAKVEDEKEIIVSTICTIISDCCIDNIRELLTNYNYGYYFTCNNDKPQMIIFAIRQKR